jgi:hypothetical protein
MTMITEPDSTNIPIATHAPSRVRDSALPGEPLPAVPMASKQMETHGDTGSSTSGTNRKGNRQNRKGPRFTIFQPPNTATTHPRRPGSLLTWCAPPLEASPAKKPSRLPKPAHPKPTLPPRHNRPHLGLNREIPPTTHFRVMRLAPLRAAATPLGAPPRATPFHAGRVTIAASARPRDDRGYPARLCVTKPAPRQQRGAHQEFRAGPSGTIQP